MEQMQWQDLFNNLRQNKTSGGEGLPPSLTMFFADEDRLADSVRGGPAEVLEASTKPRQERPPKHPPLSMAQALQCRAHSLAKQGGIFEWHFFAL